MLEALKLEKASNQVKARSGTGSDPTDAAFAGLMAQASLTSRSSSTPEISRQDPSSKRDAAVHRRETPADQAPAVQKERPASEQPPVESPNESKDSAKAAATPVREKTGKPTEQQASEQGTDPDQAIPPVPVQAQVPLASNTQLGSQGVALEGQATTVEVPAAPPEGQRVASGLPTVKPETSVATPEGQTAKPPRVDATLQGLPQEIQTAEEAPTAAIKPALTELLYLPRNDIQTPKLNPGMLLADEPDGLALSQQTETPVDTKPGIDPAALDPNPEKPSVQFVGREEGRLPSPETLAPQPQKQPASVVNPSTLALEGVKASPPAVHLDPTAAVRPSPVFTQVEGGIRWILHNKIQGAELQLHPESLGRMVVQLRVEGLEVHARLWASEPTSLAILQDHKAFLEASLREQGLNLGSFDLQSGARGDGAQTAPRDQPPFAFPLPEAKQELPMVTTLDSVEAHRLELFA